MGRRGPRTQLRVLTAEEETALERIERCGSERVDRVRRARALLAVRAGGTCAVAASASGYGSGRAVGYLVARFNAVGLAALDVAAGRGRKRTYDETARATDGGHGAAGTRPAGGRQRRLVLESVGAGIAPGGTAVDRGHHHPARAGRGREQLPTHPDVVPDGHCHPQAQGRPSRGRGPAHRAKKGAIDRAYRYAETAGVAVFGQDEAGPYQTKPQPGATWAPEGEPLRQPHEYLREGTAKLLALLRPRTGELRAEAVTSAPNAVLHPWLERELSAALAVLPPPLPDAPYPELREWRTWLGHEPVAPLPPLRAILIWDNLAGHCSADIVTWLFAQGVLPLYTPLSRILAEHDGIRATHRLWPGAHRHLSPDPSGPAVLPGRGSGRLERPPDTVRLGWQAL